MTLDKFDDIDDLNAGRLPFSEQELKDAEKISTEFEQIEERSDLPMSQVGRLNTISEKPPRKLTARNLLY